VHCGRRGRCADNRSLAESMARTSPQTGRNGTRSRRKSRDDFFHRVTARRFAHFVCTSFPVEIFRHRAPTHRLIDRQAARHAVALTFNSVELKYRRVIHRRRIARATKDEQRKQYKTIKDSHRNGALGAARYCIRNCLQFQRTEGCRRPAGAGGRAGMETGGEVGAHGSVV